MRPAHIQSKKVMKNPGSLVTADPGSFYCVCLLFCRIKLFCLHTALSHAAEHVRLSEFIVPFSLRDEMPWSFFIRIKVFAEFLRSDLKQPVYFRLVQQSDL